MAKEVTNILEKEHLRIVVHTASFCDSAESMAYFDALSKYRQFSIYYLPVAGCNTLNGTQPGQYEHIREKHIIYSTIQFSDCSGCIGTHHEINGVVFSDLSDVDLDQMAEHIIVSGNTYAAPFDLVVVSDKWAAENTTEKNTVLSMTDFRETLRLYMVHTKQFYISPCERIDELFYYTYRHKAVFRQFQPFWSSTVYSNALDSYADALDNRLMQFLLCVDNIKVILLKEQNNITAMHLKYHVPYMTLLTTGIFDNLAWLINNKYGLQLSRMKVDLKKTQYIDAVRTKSAVLADYLSDDFIQLKIDAIREIRDRIVHRDFIQTIRSGSRSASENYLFVDAAIKEKLEKAGFPKSGLPDITHSFVCIDIKTFATFIEETVIQIVNAVLGSINSEIYGSTEEICIWKLLDLPHEPLII